MRILSHAIGIVAVSCMCLIVIQCCVANDKAINDYAKSIKGNSSIIVWQ